MHSKDRCKLIYPAGAFKPSDWLRFIHFPLFENEWSDLNLDDDALQVLQIMIMAGADRHPVVPGTGGLRKIRFAEPGSNRGKSGSYRVGYAHFPDYQTVLLITVWGKTESSNLPAGDRKAIAEVIQEIRELLNRNKI